MLDLPNDEDYFKPIIVNSAFNSSYIQYECMEGEGKDKYLSIKEYLDKIKPYLSDMINICDIIKLEKEMENSFW